MIKLLELRELIKLVNQSSIEEMNLVNRGVKISMKKSNPVITAPMVIEDPHEMVQTGIHEAAVALEASPPEAVPVSEEEKGEVPLRTIASPVVGIFSSAVCSETGTHVKAGDKIKVNSIVCICNVEPLKIFYEIKSDVSGVVVEVLAKEGQLVEYGQPLYLVKPE